MWRRHALPSAAQGRWTGLRTPGALPQAAPATHMAQTYFQIYTEKAKLHIARIGLEVKPRVGYTSAAVLKCLNESWPNCLS